MKLDGKKPGNRYSSICRNLENGWKLPYGMELEI